MKSYGEKITVTLTDLGGTATNVRIHSECGMPTQLMDLGKNMENVTYLFGFLTQGLPQVQYQPQPVRQPVQQPYQAQPAVQQPYQAVRTQQQEQPQAAGPKFCFRCGAKLTPGAKFCTSCGGKIL